MFGRAASEVLVFIKTHKDPASLSSNRGIVKVVLKFFENTI